MPARTRPFCAAPSCRHAATRQVSGKVDKRLRVVRDLEAEIPSISGGTICVCDSHTRWGNKTLRDLGAQEVWAEPIETAVIAHDLVEVPGGTRMGSRVGRRGEERIRPTTVPIRGNGKMDPARDIRLTIELSVPSFGRPDQDLDVAHRVLGHAKLSIDAGVFGWLIREDGTRVKIPDEPRWRRE